VLENMVIKVGEFIYLIDLVVFEVKKMANVGNQIFVILESPFLATSNVLINCRNGKRKLSFDNRTLELNIFHLHRQSLRFDDTKTSTLN